MSASYTLHVAPYAAPGDAEALDRASLVRDGFAFWAFLVPPLWFFVHRHWLLGLILTLLLTTFWVLLRYSGLPVGATSLMNTFLWGLIGLEASTLRRWDYTRQGRPAVDVVFAANEAEAEAKSFARWLEPDAVQAGPPPLPVPARAIVPGWAPRDEPHVIGMFPDMERRR